jgi:hypothetical protein
MLGWEQITVTVTFNCNKVLRCPEIQSRKLRLTTVRDPPRSPRDTPLSTKVDTKFRRQVAVAQSVYFARGLRATEFVCCPEILREGKKLKCALNTPNII